jgi:hypothetical protein
MPRRLVLMVALAGLALAACSNGESGGTTGNDRGSDAISGAGEDALVDASTPKGGLASCVMEFSVPNLADRQFAFDGTVTEIRDPASAGDAYAVVFEVAHWFAGAEGATTTVRTYDVSGTALAGDLGLSVGDRVLASGDEDFLWGCGFSMAYSDENAALFEEAFGP